MGTSFTTPGQHPWDPFRPDPDYPNTQEYPWWYGAYDWMRLVNDPSLQGPSPYPSQQGTGGTQPPQTFVPAETQPEPTIADIPNIIDWTNFNVLWPWGWDDTKIGEQPQIDPTTGQPVYTTTTVGQPAGLSGKIAAGASTALAAAAAAGAFGGGTGGGGTQDPSVYDIGYKEWAQAMGLKDVPYDVAPIPQTLDPFINPNPPQVLNYDWAPQPTTLKPGNVPPESKPPEGEKPKTPSVPKIPIPTGGGGGGAPMPVGNFPVVGGGPELRSVFVPVTPEGIPILSLGQLLAGGLPYAR